MKRVSLFLSGLLLFGLPAAAQDAPTASQPSFQAFIFGDMIYEETDRETPEGFDLGQMVAHGNAILSDRVLFFGEMSLTGRSTGYTVEVERAILRYDFSDALKISAGRYHTAISYWNTAFHHGLWLQGSVDRPESVKFGSRFIPVHFVGAQIEGQIPETPVHYVGGIGNGRADNIARAGDAGDPNDARALLASASVRPAGLLGFRVGGGVYLDEVPLPEGADADERILSGHLVWDRGAIEFISEYFDVQHEDPLSGAETSSDAFYLYLGHRLPGAWRSVMPYARYERVDIGEGDVVFEGQVADFEAFVAGVRYDFAGLSALKLEYRNEEIDGGERLDGIFVQASFAVPLFGG